MLEQAVDGAQVVSDVTSLLGCHVDTRLKPRLSMLARLTGLDSEDICFMVARYPKILMKTEEGLKRRIGFLSDWGLDSSAITKVIKLYPQVLSPSS